MQRRTNLILAAAAAIGVLGLTQPAGASVTSSNGTGIAGCPGSVEVAVTLSGLCDDDSNNALNKVFFEVVEHEMEWNFVEGNTFNFSENIENETGIAWLDFHISFESIASGPFEIQEFFAAVNDQMLDNVIIEMTNDDMLTEIWIFFDAPLTAEDTFFLGGNIFTGEFVEGIEVRVLQHPSIPEPGSLALFATGLLALALFARRRRRLAA